MSNVLQEWIKALRSGKYKQNKNSLVSKDGCSYCVLGVLCDTIDPFGWRVFYDKSNEKNFSNSSFYWKSYSASTIPEPLIPVFAKYGIDVSFVRNLCALNDRGYSFETLASIIEEKLSR